LNTRDICLLGHFNGVPTTRLLGQRVYRMITVHTHMAHSCESGATSLDLTRSEKSRRFVSILSCLSTFDRIRTNGECLYKLTISAPC